MDGFDLKAFQRALHHLSNDERINPATREAVLTLRESLPDDVEIAGDATLDAGDDSSGLWETLTDTGDGSADMMQSAGRVPTRAKTPPPSDAAAGDNPFRDLPHRRRATTNPSIPTGTQLDRFVNLGLVGKGGMGEVYRVLDPALKRRMVLKVLRSDQQDDEVAVARFLEEARITAQLHHPGIVPVHELGVLEDGRLFFTMREVRGRTLKEVIAETHEAYEACEPDERDWHTHFQALIDVFFRACEPVAYAHAQGIIHRDLKPSNIMVGDFGEVQILDWGLAKAVGSTEMYRETESLDLADLQASTSTLDTRRGSIMGTPTFMSPEQARGEHDTLGPRADVYSLGTILFMVLDGETPFTGVNAATILFQVVDGVGRPPGTELGTPSDLVELCLTAMSVEAEDRPGDAAEFAEAISNWRDGSNRRKKAQQLIETADEHMPHYRELVEQAQQLRTRSRRMLREIPSVAPIAEKRPAWSLQEEAELLEREASTHRARAIQCLDTALTHVPEFEPAHDRLATIYRRDHAEAERRRDLSTADSLEVFIRAHNTGRFDDYLAGDGRLSLRTSPPGARVNISRYVHQDRRLVSSLERFLGHTPIIDEELPMGSYHIEIQASGRATVNYPVFIGRQATWSGSPDGDDAVFHVDLPFSDELAEDDVYVPGSNFWRGGDERATDGPPRSIRWVDPFVIKKFPVTHRQYLKFLNDLVARDENDKADRYCPRNAGNVGVHRKQSIYHRDANGVFVPKADAEEFLDLPVNLVDWYSARAYARWVATSTGLPWRLPSSDEWEKAARGVDGRFFPWGDKLDPTLCRMLHSARTDPGPVANDTYPADESPYGMRGAAGNIRDWCLPNKLDERGDISDETLVPFRGGCWFSTSEMCRLAGRGFKPTVARSAGTGFRIARDLREI